MCAEHLEPLENTPLHTVGYHPVFSLNNIGRLLDLMRVHRCELITRLQQFIFIHNWALQPSIVPARPSSSERRFYDGHDRTVDGSTPTQVFGKGASRQLFLLG